MLYKLTKTKLRVMGPGHMTANFKAWSGEFLPGKLLLETYCVLFDYAELVTSLINVEVTWKTLPKTGSNSLYLAYHTSSRHDTD